MEDDEHEVESIAKDTFLHDVVSTTNHESNDLERFLFSHLQKKRSLQDYCVTNETELRMVIMTAPNWTTTTSTWIDICIPILMIHASLPNQPYGGIDIQNMNLVIQCKTTTPHCIFDAQGLSRQFLIIEHSVIS
jgi:hypothetical protein